MILLNDYKVRTVFSLKRVVATDIRESWSENTLVTNPV